MAQSDLDAMKTAKDFAAATAEENLDGLEQSIVDTDSAEAAAAAGVSKPEYIDYADALEAYEARTDVENLASRRAREVGDQFTDTDFMRSDDYAGSSGI